MHVVQQSTCSRWIVLPSQIHEIEGGARSVLLLLLLAGI